MTMTADEFKAIRLSHNFTQDQLADRMEKRRGSISRYEAGEPIPFLVEFYMRSLQKRTVFVTYSKFAGGETDQVTGVFANAANAEAFCDMNENAGDFKHDYCEIILS